MNMDKTARKWSADFSPLRRATADEGQWSKRAEARAPSASVFVRVHTWLNSPLFRRPDDFVKLCLETHRQRVGDDAFRQRLASNRCLPGGNALE